MHLLIRHSTRGWLMMLLGVGGCGGDAFVKTDAKVEGCVEGQLQCVGTNLQACKAGIWENQQACTAPQVCSATLGRCAECDPALSICVGDEVHKCGSDGKVGEVVTTCAAGKCFDGACGDPCGKAAAARSYVGCDYWPTVTLNAQLMIDFSFAVAVANAQNRPATITVSSASNASVATTTVPPNALATMVLPWVMSLKQDINTGIPVSVLEPAGAYHLVSNVPVSVYQFNALDYVLNKECSRDDKKPDGKCYSYTNDASLVLPETALTGEYMVISRPTQMVHDKQRDQWGASSGFFAVTAPKDGTTKVDVTFSADTQAGVGGKLAAYNKGQSASFTLPKWGVLEIASRIPTTACTPAATDTYAEYCDLSATTDLTGTLIKADKNVAVFSGHDCTFVPFNKWACDHLEEQIFPTKSWGRRYLVSHTTSSGADPNLYRIVSADAGNQVTFKPDTIHAPATLDVGKWIEFTSTEDFEVSGTGRLAVVQFMVGQNFSNPTPGEGAPGDPSMALAVPVEQFRTNYRFLAPQSYQQNYVNVIALKNATINLDGTAIEPSKFTPLTDNYKVAKLPITGGSHLAESSSTFGIAVYGVGSYTSYMYPGGLDLKLLE